MRLLKIDYEMAQDELSDDVSRIIERADALIEQLDAQTEALVAAFVPSDFEPVYRALCGIEAAGLAAGHQFVEWGSGIGAITCLATLAGFDAVGIEIERPLVEVAHELAAELKIDAQFACGSFVPPDSEPQVDTSDEVVWLRTDGADGYAELGLEPDDFDIVFAYPWPGEEQVIYELFQQSAAVGTLLLTNHGQEGLALHRKVRH